MNERNIKMLALDIDGTLLDANKQLPEINRRALCECERQGIQIALISGRSFEIIRRFAFEWGISPLIAAANGARIEQSAFGPTLGEFCFATADAQRVCRALENSGMYFNVYCRGKCFMGNAHVKESLGPRYAHHIVGMSGDADYPYETVCDRERLWSEGLQGVYKFVVMGAVYDTGFDRLRAELADMQLSVSSASKRNCEFMPTGVDKGSAVRLLCEKLGISAENVMAFGDQTNDLPMLSAAGWPIAMENGENLVKAAARIIAPDHNQGGVGQVLQKYVLGGMKL